MTSTAIRDYASTGMTIQQALVDHVKRHPDKLTRPDFVFWNGRQIKTSDVWITPENGIVRAELLSCKTTVEQGFDMKVNGFFELAEGEQVPVLRTWKDERFEDEVEYTFSAPEKKLWVWNVYKMQYPSGQIVVEKWTGNAGFWIEQVGENERVYHCSHGMATQPDFESLVFKLSVKSAKP